MILFTYQVIGAIALFNMHKAKDYNLEGPVKEGSSRKSKTTIRAGRTAMSANFQMLQKILS